MLQAHRASILMALDSRSKMISFRLSAEEYEKIRDLCFRQGIQSVSEMARAGLNLLLEQPERAPSESLELRMRELEGRLHIIALQIKKMTQAQ